MTTFAILLFLFTNPNHQLIIRTDIYDPLSFHTIQKTNKNTVAILDSRESQLHFYTLNGEHLKTIDGKNQGPQSLLGVRSLKLIDGSLYAVGTGKVVKIGENLEVEDAYKVPNSEFQPIAGGGFVSFNLPMLTIYPIEIRIHETLSDEGILIETLPNTPMPPSLELKYNPVRKKSSIQISRNNDFLIWQREDVLGKLWVYDLKKREIVHVFHFQGRPIPFPKEWGNERVTEFQNRMEKYGVTISADFPDTLPYIRGVRITHDDKILINLWGKNPEIQDFHLFSPKGKEENLPSAGLDGTPYIIFQEKDIAFVCAPDQDEAAAIFKVPASEMFQFAAEAAKKFPCSYCE